jgi:plastocyanin
LKLRIFIAALVGGLVLGGCGDASPSDEVIEGQDITVEMYDNRFQYTEIRVPVGGTIEWLGAGRNPHNVVAADGSWSTEEVFGSPEQYEGDSAVLTYEEPGEYVFFCTFHGNAQGGGMAGLLIVGEGGS